MAHMNKALKADIMAKVKAVLPQGWKVSAKVFHHSTLKVTVRQMPRADFNAMVYVVE